MGVLKGKQLATQSCYEVNCYNKRNRKYDVMMVDTRKSPIPEDGDDVCQGVQAVDRLLEVCLEPRMAKVVKMGKALGEAEKSRLVRFLQEH